jgi:hypothetical protein
MAAAERSGDVETPLLDHCSSARGPVRLGTFNGSRFPTFQAAGFIMFLIAFPLFVAAFAATQIMPETERLALIAPLRRRAEQGGSKERGKP